MLTLDMYSAFLTWPFAAAAVLLGCLAAVIVVFARQMRIRRDLERTVAELRATLADVKETSQTKAHFLTTMSYELRTPLNAIIGFSEILKGQLFGPLGNERYRDYAGAICESGEHLLTLVNDILDISKLDAGKLELQDDFIDVSAALKACRRLVEPQARKAEVRFTVDVADTLPVLRADDRRVRQVLINLFSNAVKFTPGGGEVKVSVFRKAGALAISVADTGIGMAKADIPKALERFGQIDSTQSRQHVGSGLGLPLSKQLMELHGGTLDIDSELHVGTTVTVLFPPSRVVATLAAA